MELARQTGSAAGLAPIDDVGVHVPDELLRNGARAAAILVEDLPLDRAEHSDDVDAVVLVEPLVFNRDEGLADVLRKRANRDVGAHLLPDLADQRSVARVDERRLRDG